MINGNLGTVNVSIERAQCPGHEPRIVSGSLDITNEVVACGTLLTRADDNSWVRLAAETNKVIGAGDGSAKDFTATLPANLQRGAVKVTDGVEVFVDDGCGNLAGTDGGTGTVNYRTGGISVTFAAAPANGADVTADYFTSPDGVLDEPTDTNVTTVGNIVIHGTVREGALVVGAAATAPAEDVLIALQTNGVFPA